MVTTPIGNQEVHMFIYYPGQKTNQYSQDIHEIDLQFDHVISHVHTCHMIVSMVKVARNEVKNASFAQ